MLENKKQLKSFMMKQNSLQESIKIVREEQPKIFQKFEVVINLLPSFSFVLH